MVQPNDDLALTFTISWNGEQGSHVGYCHRPQKWKEYFYADKLLRDGNTLWVISWRDRTWWRNLRGGAKAWVLLAGKNVEGCGQVIEEEEAVARSLFDYYRKAPQYAKYVKISLDTAGQPVSADCERAAQKMVVVRIDLK